MESSNVSRTNIGQFQNIEGVMTLIVGSSFEKMVIPATHQGMDLTSIGTMAFYRNDYLQELVIPSSVTVVEAMAFAQCRQLRKVSFSEGLKVLEQGAFMGCPLLTEVVLPESLEVIQRDNFNFCGALEKIECLGHDTVCEKTVAVNCKSLTSTSSLLWKGLNLPELYRVTEGLLDRWDSLSWEECQEFLSFVRRKPTLKHAIFSSPHQEHMAILLGEGVKPSLTQMQEYLETSIGESRTKVTAMLLEYKDKHYSQQEVDSLQERTELVEIGLELPTFKELRKKWICSSRKGQIRISGYRGTEREEVMPERSQEGTEIAIVGHSSSGNFGTLERLTLPDTVKHIGDKAFQVHVDLQELVFPSSLETVGEFAFAHCTTLAEPNFPQGLQKIMQGAFCNCDEFRQISLPETVQYLGSNAFSHCNNLESFEFQGASENRGTFIMGDICFARCKNLKKIVLPEGLKELPNFAFHACESLEEVHLPESLERIGVYVFYGCENLKTINMDESKVLYNKYSFEGTAFSSIYLGNEA